MEFEFESSEYQDDQVDHGTEMEEVSQPIYHENDYHASGAQQFTHTVSIPQDTIDPNEVSQPMYFDTDDASNVVDGDADFYFLVPLDSDAGVSEPNYSSTTYSHENLNVGDLLPQNVAPLTIEPDWAREEGRTEENCVENAIETDLLIEGETYPAKEEPMNECKAGSVLKPICVVDEMCPLQLTETSSIKQEQVNECSTTAGKIDEGNALDTNIFTECDPLLAETTELPNSNEAIVKAEPQSECKEAAGANHCNLHGYPTSDDLGSVEMQVNTVQEDVKSEQTVETCLNCEMSCRIRQRLQDYVHVNQQGEFRCVDCFATFKLKSDALFHAFRQHRGCYVTERDSNNKRHWYHCPLCSYNTANQSYLDLHIKNHTNLRYKCPNVGCDRIFEKKQSIEFHMINHRESQAPLAVPSSFLCTMCLSDIRERRPGMNYLDECNRETEEMFECSLCAELFGTKVLLCKHILNEHEGSSYSNFICPECFRLFQDQSELKSHVRNHKKLKYNCVHCGWTYRQQFEWLKHLKNDHTELERKRSTFAYEIQCGKCPKSFPSLDALNVHMGTHEHPTCSKCGKTFRTEQLLKQHDTFIHGEGKHYRGSHACPMCPRTFLSGKSFDKHMAEHYSGALQHRCPYKGCRRFFKSFYFLKYHVRAHKSHVKCARCQIELMTRLIYEKHISECTALFKCDECTQEFGRRDELDEHCLIHDASKETDKELNDPRVLDSDIAILTDQDSDTRHETRPECTKDNIGSSPFFAKDKCSLCKSNIQYKTSEDDYVVKGSCSRFQCVECFEPFNSKGPALWHAVCRHNGVIFNGDGNFKTSRFYECFVCTRHLPLKLFEEHMKTHQRLTTKCSNPKCGWMFSSSAKGIWQYKVHLKTCGTIEDTKRTNDIMCSNCFSQITDKRRYHCIKCSDKFHTKSQRNQHWNAMHVRGNLAGGTCVPVCPLCGREFLKWRQVEVHVKLHRLMSAECPKCGWQFNGYNGCISHLQGKHDDRSTSPIKLTRQRCRTEYKCPHCRFLYPNQNALEYHIKVEHEMKKPIPACSQCGRHFPSLRSLKAHLGNHSSMVHRCPLCGFAFEKIYKLEAHIKHYHVFNYKKDTTATTTVNENPKPAKWFACVKCNDQFNSQAALKNHYLSTHDTTFKCEHCKKGFGTIELLESHTRTTHTEPSGNAQGMPVKDSFERRESSFSKRQYSSKTERNYVCRECNMSFEDMKSFYIHTKSLHFNASTGNQSEDKLKSRKRQSSKGCKKNNYLCRECNVLFEGRESFFIHMKNLHSTTGTVKQITDENYYVCGKCDTSFKEVNAFYTHTQNAHSENYYVCGKCDMSFKEVNAFYTHTQNVHSENYYVCGKCDMSFKEMNAFYTHTQNVHSETSTRKPQSTAVKLIGSEHGYCLPNDNYPTKSPVLLMRCSKCKQIFTDMKLFCHHAKTAHPKATEIQEPSETIVNVTESDNDDIQTDSPNNTVFHSDAQNKFPPEIRDPQYKCTECNLFFMDMQSFSLHAISMHPNAPAKLTASGLDVVQYKCFECKQSFEDVESLCLHAKSCFMHSNASTKEVTEPTENVTGNESKNIQRAPQSRDDQNILNKSDTSAADALKNGLIKFRCVRCRDRFPDAESLYLHNKNKHSKEKGMPRLFFENKIEYEVMNYPSPVDQQPVHENSQRTKDLNYERQDSDDDSVTYPRVTTSEQRQYSDDDSVTYPRIATSEQLQDSDEDSESEEEPAEEYGQLGDEIRSQEVTNYQSPVDQPPVHENSPRDKGLNYERQDSDEDSVGYPGVTTSEQRQDSDEDSVSEDPAEEYGQLHEEIRSQEVTNYQSPVDQPIVHENSPRDKGLNYERQDSDEDSVGYPGVTTSEQRQDSDEDSVSEEPAEEYGQLHEEIWSQEVTNYQSHVDQPIVHENSPRDKGLNYERQDSDEESVSEEEPAEEYGQLGDEIRSQEVTNYQSPVDQRPVHENSPRDKGLNYERQDSDEESVSEEEPAEEYGQLRDEIRSATELDGMDFRCELCEQKFMYGGLLISHLISEHKWEDRRKVPEINYDMIRLRTPVVVLKRLSESVLRRYGYGSSKQPRRKLSRLSRE